jgi:N-acyl-D-aspartate/D-glutamate deacylase
VIDATGKVVAPGFIDLQGRSGIALLADGVGESHLRQGITTEILGAQSPVFWTRTTADEDALRVHGVTLDWSGLIGYFDKLESRGTAINVGTFAPLSTATGTAAIDEALRDGAFGAIDDRGVTAADLNAAGAAVARNDGVLVVPAGHPIVGGDDALVAAATQARRLLIADVAHPPAGQTTADVIARIVRVNQRGVPTYATVVPGSQPVDETPARDALRYGGVMVATDSAAITAAAAAADAPPAAFGAFPRLLGQIVRDAHMMELREAIRRSTSLPASVLRLPERGIIRERWFADLVIFDASAIADRATADKPNQYPAGLDYVIVNGVVAVTPKGLTGARPGYRLLHRSAGGT